MADDRGPKALLLPDPGAPPAGGRPLARDAGDGDRRPSRWPRALALVVALGLAALLLLTGQGDDPAEAPLVPDGEAAPDLPAEVTSAGDLEWAVTIEGAGGRAPVVVGGVVAVATDGGEVVGIEATTGALLWESPAAGPRPTDPVVSGDLVVTAAGPTIAAVDTTGEPRWSVELPDDVAGRPVPAATRLLVATGRGDVLALDGATGAVRWSRRLSGPVTAPIAGDTAGIAVASGRTLLGLEAATGDTATSVELDDPVALVGIAHGIPFGATTAGQVAFGAQVRGVLPGGPFVARPVAVGDVAVFAGEGGAIQAIDVRAGASRWQRTAAGRVTAPLIARRDVVVVTTDDGHVHRLDPFTGRHLATARTGDAARTAANPGAGPAVFTADDADVVAGLRAAGR